MVQAIRKEFFLRKEELTNSDLASIYFGGGTPSVLSPDDISTIIEDVSKKIHFKDTIEITLEANPDDLDASYLNQLKSTAINRLSIGTQSFNDADLKMMNRAHNAQQAEYSIKKAQDVGFQNISIDLIYGAQTADLEIWNRNIKKTLELQVPHISSYALTVEPKTALHHQIEKGKLKPPDENLQSQAFDRLCRQLKENGFEHYEISNFAKPGFHSKHNSAYWNYQQYLGLGPSAHSYNGKNRRSWNIANNQKYLEAILQNQLPTESEILSENDQFNEMVMIGLRTAKGVNLDNLNQKFSKNILKHFHQTSAEKLEMGILQIENNHLIIPEKHWFLADGIASDLFILD